MTHEEIKQSIATIKSEVKDAPEILFPVINFETLIDNTNTILNKAVEEGVKISRLENNPDKREFAKTGLRIHKKGDVCSFCESKIDDSVFEELEHYFSADEVKAF